jgi:hypothetical protein
LSAILTAAYLLDAVTRGLAVLITGFEQMLRNRRQNGYFCSIRL